MKKKRISVCGKNFWENDYVYYLECGDGVIVKYFIFLPENEFEIL